METLCRKLSGERFALAEEARFCLDIQPEWSQGEQFEKAHDFFETVVQAVRE
jgi:hypothetical protein